MPNGDLNRLHARVGNLDDVWNLNAGLAGNVLAEGLRNGLAFVARLVVAHIIVLGGAAILSVANPARNGGAAMAIAHIVHDGLALFLRVANIAGNGLANGVVSIAALLLILRMALVIILGMALSRAPLNLAPIASARDHVGSIERFKLLGFQAKGLVLLI